MLLTPIFGSIYDKKGKGASIMILGAVLLIVVHVIFYLPFITSVVAAFFNVLLLGIAFSLVPAAMWPSVSKIVPEHRIGTAYGAMFSFQNLGLFGVPILAGTVLDMTNPGVTSDMIEAGAKLEYTPTMLMFVGFGVIGFIFALLLKWDDKTSGYGLELPSNEIVETENE